MIEDQDTYANDMHGNAAQIAHLTYSNILSMRR